MRNIISIHSKMTIFLVIGVMCLADGAQNINRTRFEYLLIKFEYGTVNMTKESKDQLEKSIDEVFITSKLKNYQVLIRSVDCPAELENNNLISLKRKKLVLDFCKERTKWKSARIYIDEWNSEIDTNKQNLCAETGVYLFAESIYDPFEDPFNSLDSVKKY